MPSSAFEYPNAGGSPPWSYEEAAQVPLPGPALVIDVRQFEERTAFEPMALVVYLWTEVQDLASTMRQHDIAGWGSLQQFLNFRKVNAGEASEYILTDPQTWEPGQEPVYCEAEQLAPNLGALVNAVRNQRMRLARAGDPSQTTVRVIFVVDLDDQQPEQEALPMYMIGRANQGQRVASFDLAVTCANKLKEWSSKEQGVYSDATSTLEGTEQGWQRASYGPMLETVALCLNTRPQYHRCLTEANAVRALDTFILVYPYRSDYGHLDTQAQVSHAELLLSALLLHWPEAMQANIEDQPLPLVSGDVAHPLPRPMYILGATAIEHATRWGERWWDYGLETALVEQLLAHESIASQDLLLQSAVEQWWSTWCNQVQWALARLTGHLSQLDGLRHLGQLSHPDPFQASSLAELKQRIEKFFEQIKFLYSAQGRGSLSEVLANAPLLVSLSQHIHKPSEVSASAWQRYVEALRLPERQAYVCLPALFTQARGSIPRALRQLQLLEARSERLHLDINRCDLSALLYEWESWFSRAYQRLETLAQGPRRFGWWERQLMQKEQDGLLKSVQHLQHKQYAIIYNALCAHYQLALLEQAEMPKPYEKRLQALQLFLERTRKRARFLRDVAAWRLALGSAEPLVDAYTQQARPATLFNRQDHLNQRALLRYFEQAWDALAQGEEAFSTQFLAQATLRLLGPEERTSNGHLPQPNHVLGEHQTQEQFHVLELLLVSSFLACRAGAPVAKIEPLLLNYRQAWLRLQPEPSLLTQAIHEMEESVRSVSLHKKMYGSELMPTLAQQMSDELPLAALLANQPREPVINATLAPTNLLRFLKDDQRKATEIVRQLDSQATLTGPSDTVSGQETCYLYLPAGLEGESFEQGLEQQLQSTIHIVRTPNIEKMMYLRIHRIYQFPGDTVPRV